MKKAKVLAVVMCLFLVFSALGLSEAAAGRSNAIEIVTVEASSVENEELAVEKAIDGDFMSRWASEYGEDIQWLTIDLGSSRKVNALAVAWETAAALVYKVQTSSDGLKWNDAAEIHDGKAGIEVITFPTVTARYIRIFCLERASEYGYSIHEIAVYNN